MLLSCLKPTNKGFILPGKKILVLTGLLTAFILNIVSGIINTAPTLAASLAPLPSGLKTTFTLGLANQPGNISWMKTSGAAWDTRYQYLSGGVNTAGNWKTWQWDQLPPGQFALDYMTESYNNGYLPVLTWYQLLQSTPATGTSEAEQTFTNLNNPTTMNAYFADFKLLLDKAKAFGQTVIIHL